MLAITKVSGRTPVAPASGPARVRRPTTNRAAKIAHGPVARHERRDLLHPLGGNEGQVAKPLDRPPAEAVPEPVADVVARPPR